jgi:hypothetical protein
MAGANENYATGNLDPPIDVSCDSARISVSGVGNEAGAGTDSLFVEARGEKRIDLGTKFPGIIWIETAGDRRFTNHSEPSRLTSAWRACL